VGNYRFSALKLSESRVQKIPDPESASKKIFITLNTVSKLSKNCLFIPDLDFFSIPNPGPGTRGSKAPDPGSITLEVMCLKFADPAQ
jgi:hypothetical protein